MTNTAKKVIATVMIILLIWVGMFAVDFIRCSTLREPVFVIPVSQTADDGGSGVYCGLGYTVQVSRHIDADLGLCLDSVCMEMLGIVIAGSVS